MLKQIVRILFIAAIIIANIGCDQVSKTIVRERVEYNADIKFVHNLVTLTKVENTGAFLSLGAKMSKPLKWVFLNGLPLMALAFGVFFLFYKTDLSKTTRLGLCCILGGGIGNLYDRVLYGSVTDFLHIDFVLFQTGIFNLADVSIMVGAFFLLVEMLLKRREAPQYF
jgi:signal peptidase II